jgi:hypothetical protein
MLILITISCIGATGPNKASPFVTPSIYPSPRRTKKSLFCRITNGATAPSRMTTTSPAFARAGQKLREPQRVIHSRLPPAMEPICAKKLKCIFSQLAYETAFRKRLVIGTPKPRSSPCLVTDKVWYAAFCSILVLLLWARLSPKSVLIYTSSRTFWSAYLWAELAGRASCKCLSRVCSGPGVEEPMPCLLLPGERVCLFFLWFQPQVPGKNRTKLRYFVNGKALAFYNVQIWIKSNRSSPLPACGVHLFPHFPLPQS